MFTNRVKLKDENDKTQKSRSWSVGGRERGRMGQRIGSKWLMSAIGKEWVNCFLNCWVPGHSVLFISSLLNVSMFMKIAA